MLDSTLESMGERLLLGQPREELALRVCGGPRDGHVVRLAAPRCSVGSSDRCTLRLRGPGIRPLHCVILRGAERTVVRRWSPDTLLNGRDFADAALVIGDQITVGPILFEVVPADSVSSPTAALRNLTGDLPTEANPEVQREPDPGLEEIQRIRAELDARQAELDRQQLALAEEQQRFRADCDAATQAQARAQEQIDGLRARLETERTSFRRQCDDERSEQNGRAAELDARAEELAARARRLDQREAEIGSASANREQGLASGQDSYRTAADAIYAGSLESAVEPAGLRFEPVSEEAPTSAAAVLHRLGADALTDDESESPLDAAASDVRFGRFQSATSGQDAGSAHAPAAGGDDEDESVQEYMARLMERVGAKQGGQPAAPTVRPTIERQRTPQPVAAPLVPSATPHVEEQPKLQRLERRSAPELSADLSRMRALANESARTVLDDHFRRKLYYMTIGKASVAIAALLAGLVLLWWSSHGTRIAFYLATVSFAIATIWLLQYAIAVGYLIRSHSKHDHEKNSDQDRGRRSSWLARIVRGSASTRRGASQAPVADSAGEPTTELAPNEADARTATDAQSATALDDSDETA